MQISRAIFLAAAAVSSCLASKGSAEPTVLIPAHPMNLLDISRQALQGVTPSGENVRVSVDRSENGIVTISADRDGTSLGSVGIESTRFDRIDLNTIKAGTLGGDIIVTFKFGSPRPGCFVDDDGRDIVYIIFAPGSGPRIDPETYERVCT
jgi:hypothetical protein